MQENRDLGKQFVNESGIDHHLELFSQRLPFSQMAGRMTWPPERRGGRGWRGSGHGCHSPASPSFAQVSHQGLSRGAVQGKSHSDFSWAHSMLIMPVRLPGKERLAVLTIYINVGGWCLIIPSWWPFPFASFIRGWRMCYLPWLSCSYILPAGMWLPSLRTRPADGREPSVGIGGTQLPLSVLVFTTASSNKNNWISVHPGSVSREPLKPREAQTTPGVWNWSHRQQKGKRKMPFIDSHPLTTLSFVNLSKYLQMTSPAPGTMLRTSDTMESVKEIFMMLGVLDHTDYVSVATAVLILKIKLLHGAQ